jgi:hypothetical protein
MYTPPTTHARQNNVGAMCYGRPVVEMSMFDMWLATTAWPEQHDTAILFLREMRSLAGDKGLIFDSFKVEITEGKANFKSTGLSGEPIDTRAWCYRVHFTPPYPDDAKTMFGLYVVFDPQHVDQRTVGVIPVYNYEDPGLIVQDL